MLDLTLQDSGSTDLRKDAHRCYAAKLGFALSLVAMPLAAQEQTDPDATVLETIVISAERQLKQAPGVSTITSEDLEKMPPTNDLAELIRKMPGSNLTGTTSSGQRGNQRQIDLRGMGPENTLILIDGKPVLSRNSVRMGRDGERDSRGDTNWIPAEAVERIEVIRGPAAARYGSGAAGGVVNIVTKRPERITTTISTFASVPQHSEEGYTARTNVVVGGPISDTMSFRLYGSYNKTDADDVDINADVSVDAVNPPPAGREGVTNRDFGALFSLSPSDDHVIDLEATFSRQGNIFAGDRQLATTTPQVDAMIGEETNVMKRSTLSATHRGTYDFGDSLSYIQWERTRNERLLEGLFGRVEGAINSGETGTITLDNLTAKTEWNVPINLGFDQTFTLGSEFRGEWMEDGISIQQALNPGVVIPGTPSDPASRDPNSNAWMLGLYLEDNILITDRFTLTPGVRFDYHSEFGTNWSPSLNAAYELTDTVSLKAGIARAFKAPNLFQLNPNYVGYSAGGGCPVDYPNFVNGGCYIVGNPDLDAETSLNKEIGFNYRNADGWNAGVTYFHNDYRDRISAGSVPAGSTGSTGGVLYFQWENVPEAVISGLEGNLSIPITDALIWSTNATYMIETENKSTGQPLTLIPEYTINTSLDWQARENLTLVLSATHYGETKAPTQGSNVAANDALVSESRDPYTLVNLGVKWDINENYRLNAGVNNIFDKRVLREGSGLTAGANTYNEPGRTFYLGITATF